jgi:RHS repeat-associated protein
LAPGNATGPSNLITQEQQTGGTNPKTKTYAYDAFGHRLSLTDTNTSSGSTNTYSYGTDVLGSVSQLLDDAGNVKASYGYTAYGASDAPASDTESLTSGDSDLQAPLNPYRYSSRRMDSGTVPSTTPTVASGAGGYDMGARRFGPDIGSFLQQDQFSGALADLGLALDPLTQNRYALAGGNPISYVEWDGHVAQTLQQLENIKAEPAVTDPSPEIQRLENANSQPPAGPPANGASRPGTTPVAGLAPSPAPTSVSVGSRIAAAGGAILGVLLSGLLLCGDTPQCAQEKQSIDVKPEDRADECVNTPYEAPSTVGNFELKEGRATGGEACYGADANVVVDTNTPATPKGFDESDPNMERGHLIAQSFRGSSGVQNIVPMYYTANHSGMTSVEHKIWDVVSMRRRVYYFIKPEYERGNDIPVRFQIYMKMGSYTNPITGYHEAEVFTTTIENVP